MPPKGQQRSEDMSYSGKQRLGVECHLRGLVSSQTCVQGAGHGDVPVGVRVPYFGQYGTLYIPYLLETSIEPRQVCLRWSNFKAISTE